MEDSKVNISEIIDSAERAVFRHEYNHAIELLDGIKIIPEIDEEKINLLLVRAESYTGLGEYEKAISILAELNELTEDNGNIEYLLGYVYLLNRKEVDAILWFTKALKNLTNNEMKAGIYTILADLNIQNMDFKSASINLEQANKESPIFDYNRNVNLANCYLGLSEIRKAESVIELLRKNSPGRYEAYSLLFTIYIASECWSEAKKVIDYVASRDNIAKPTAYYKDRITMSFFNYSREENEESIKKILEEYDRLLFKGRPAKDEIFEAYSKAADIYISMDKLEKGKKSLEAAQNLVKYFNAKFSVVNCKCNDSCAEDNGHNENNDADEWNGNDFADIEDGYDIQDDETYDQDDEAIFEGIKKSVRYFEEEEEYLLEGSYELNTDQKDMLNQLWLVVYKKEINYYEALSYANKLIGSNDITKKYFGMYEKLEVYKSILERDDQNLLGKIVEEGLVEKGSNWESECNKTISEWDEILFLNPYDQLAAFYRARVYIDLGDFKKAKELIAFLNSDYKKILDSYVKKRGG